MKKIIFVLPLLLLISCSSTTYIKSLPSGAQIYEGDAFMGVTPYRHWDIDSSDPGNPDYTGRTFTLKKEGYRDKEINIKRNVLNVPRLFFPAPIFSLPWAYDYPGEYYFELESLRNNKERYLRNMSGKQGKNTEDGKTYGSASKKLRELRELYNEGLLTEDEYEEKRQAIIDEM